jgi:hypothetical protein
MDAGLPWSEYSKDPLPAGYSHAVGRDEIERAFRAAGAEVGSLSLGPPSDSVGDPVSMIFDVYWMGDASRIRGPALDRDRLFMRWCAVPAGLRSVFVASIVGQWLPEACSWAASAPGRGNVWRATDQWRMLLRSGEELTVRTE